MALKFRKYLKKRRSVRRIMRRSRRTGARRLSRGAMVLKRTFDWGTFNSDVSGNVAYGATFSLSSLPNVADITTLFDSYKILKVTVKMYPMNPNVSTANIYRIMTAVDYNDANTPTASAIREYGNMRTHVLYNDRGYCQRTFRPHVLDTIYNTSISSGFATDKPSPWISTTYNGVPHYGLKIFGEGFPASTAIFRSDVTITMAVKNVH